MACARSFERQQYLKDNIKSVQIKKLKCDVCDYMVAPWRRKRLHVYRQHNFSKASVRVTQPDQVTVQTDHWPAPTMTIPVLIQTLTIPGLANPEFEIRLGVEDTLLLI